MVLYHHSACQWQHAERIPGFEKGGGGGGGGGFNLVLNSDTGVATNDDF